MADGVAVATLDQLAPGHGMTVTIRGVPVALFNKEHTIRPGQVVRPSLPTAELIAEAQALGLPVNRHDRRMLQTVSQRWKVRRPHRPCPVTPRAPTSPHALFCDARSGDRRAEGTSGG